jgi:hypothetical protein
MQMATIITVTSVLIPIRLRQAQLRMFQVHTLAYSD